MHSIPMVMNTMARMNFLSKKNNKTGIGTLEVVVIAVVVILVLAFFGFAGLHL